jgi:pyruvate,orthophosphate dikinase
MTNPSPRWITQLDGTDLPDKALIGGKAWSIARMMSLGLPVPPAFVVTTEACRAFLRDGAIPQELPEEMATAIARLEQRTGRTFGHGAKPLLISVRSGAPVSMPGMMDTILNLGITRETEAALVAECGDANFARDVHRRFYDLYSHIVLKANIDAFPPDGDAASWDRQIAAATGAGLPETAHARLTAAVRAVFESWNSRRAKRYREHHGIAHHLGTAVTIQAMVFGNRDDNSGTGVVFSRNPLTGDRTPFGEYLARAQGEDVVSGKFTPNPLSTMQLRVPAAYQGLMAACATLERENGDVQDIEFTVQNGELYLLQSRAAKRAPAAAVRIAVDMVREGMIDEVTALDRVTPEQVRLLLAPRLAEGQAAEAPILASGEGACPGVGVGVVVTSSDEAEMRAKAGDSVVLARPTTSPEDVHGMLVAKAVITETGGSTSHAAVVSRALGLPCVVGCGVSKLDGMSGRMVTVDGALGRIFAGQLKVVRPDETADPQLTDLAQWAARHSPLQVYRPGEAPRGRVIDLNAVDGGEDPKRLPALIRGYDGARGGAIASDEGVRAAVAEKLHFVVGEPVLPLLLAAVRAKASSNVPSVSTGEGAPANER